MLFLQNKRLHFTAIQNSDKIFWKIDGLIIFCPPISVLCNDMHFLTIFLFKFHIFHLHQRLFACTSLLHNYFLSASNEQECGK